MYLSSFNKTKKSWSVSEIYSNADFVFNSDEVSFYRLPKITTNQAVVIRQHNDNMSVVNLLNGARRQIHFIPFAVCETVSDSIIFLGFKPSGEFSAYSVEQDLDAKSKQMNIKFKQRANLVKGSHRQDKIISKALGVVQNCLFEYASDPAINLSALDNHLGRLSWAISPKIVSYVDHREKFSSLGFPVKDIVENASWNLIGTFGLNNNNGWPTTRYSLNNEVTSFLITDAIIAHSLLYASNRGVIRNPILQDRIVEVGRIIAERYMSQWNPKFNLYHIGYGRPFWADGFPAPNNWNSGMGLLLIELFKATENSKYLEQSHRIFRMLLSNVRFLDNRTPAWHYWPDIVYEKVDNVDRWESENGANIQLEMPDVFSDLSHESITATFLLSFCRLEQVDGCDRLEGSLLKLKKLLWKSARFPSRLGAYPGAEGLDGNFPAMKGWYLKTDKHNWYLDLLTARPFYEGDFYNVFAEIPSSFLEDYSDGFH